MADTLAYLITFRTYGSLLHGDERGSVDRNHNIFGDPMLAPNRRWHRYKERLMSQPPVILSAAHQGLVRDSIVSTCRFREWNLLAVHVRTNHAHVVVATDAPVARVLHSLKAYASRTLNQSEGVTRPQWSRHGSTLYLWDTEAVGRAVAYVMEGQGLPLAVYQSRAAP